MSVRLRSRVQSFIEVFSSRRAWAPWGPSPPAVLATVEATAASVVRPVTPTPADPVVMPARRERLVAMAARPRAVRAAALQAAAAGEAACPRPAVSRRPAAQPAVAVGGPLVVPAEPRRGAPMVVMPAAEARADCRRT